MKLTSILLLIMVLFLTSCGNGSDATHETSSSYEPYATEDFADDGTADLDKPDGDYDCTATNISRGNGPYTLDCEKDGGEVIIHFNNGGHITVDEDGYDSNSGENWDVELE